MAWCSHWRRSLELDGARFFAGLTIRGRGNDPPDLEAVNAAGERIAIEVTELVDEQAIRAYKAGRRYEIAEWGREAFLLGLQERLSAKNERFEFLKGKPYPGGYVVVVFTDETILPRPTVEQYLQGRSFEGLGNIYRAFLLLSYDPSVKRYPYFELRKAA